MVSYAYVDTTWLPTAHLAQIATAASVLAIDSGAFTEWRRAIAGRALKGVTVETYTEWLVNEAPPFAWACALDVIDNAAASVANYRRQIALAPELTDRLVPVFHEGDPIGLLDEYEPEKRLVGLGRTEGRRSFPKSFAFYDECFNRFPSGRFHALGNANPATLEPYPFTSFDAVSWQLDSTYAQSHPHPWNRVSKETRMRAYIEALETIEHRQTRQLTLF